MDAYLHLALRVAFTFAAVVRLYPLVGCRCGSPFRLVHDARTYTPFGRYHPQFRPGYTHTRRHAAPRLLLVYLPPRRTPYTRCDYRAGRRSRTGYHRVLTRCRAPSYRDRSSLTGFTHCCFGSGSRFSSILPLVLYTTRGWLHADSQFWFYGSWTCSCAIPLNVLAIPPYGLTGTAHAVAGSFIYLTPVRCRFFCAAVAAALYCTYTCGTATGWVDAPAPHTFAHFPFWLNLQPQNCMVLWTAHWF